MIFYRERPRCRKAIFSLMKENHLTSPAEVLALHCMSIFLSDGLKKECKKMILEGFKLGDYE